MNREATPAEVRNLLADLKRFEPVLILPKSVIVPSGPDAKKASA